MDIEGGRFAPVADATHDAAHTVESSIDALPRRTVGVYAVAAASWILVSDAIVVATTDADVGGYLVNSAKGLAFVAATSLALWLVLHGWAQRAGEAWETVGRARRRSEALVERSDDVIAVYGGDGKLSYVSPSMTRVLGWPVDESIGTYGKFFAHPDDRTRALEFFTAVCRHEDVAQPETLRILTSESRWRRMEVDAVDLRDEPAVDGILMRARDVTDRWTMERRLDHALTHDLVTGLANPRRFELDLRDAALAAEVGSHQLAVLVLDIVAFREVNDTVGRTRGDDVLATVAARLARLDPLVLGRLGADEFAVAVATSEADEDALAGADRAASTIRAKIGEPLSIDGHRLRLSCSIGGAVVDPDAPVTDSLARAEDNLQRAKAHPDHQVLTAPERGPRRSGFQGMSLRTSLQDAIDEGQLEVHYQPEYDLADGTVVAAEALVRWRHPTAGLLGPDRFLDDAAKSGALPAITRFVIDAGAAQRMRWAAAGRPLIVSINLALDDLRRPSLVDEVLAAAERHGCPPAQLCLELTEQTLLQEPDRGLRTMRALQAEGVRFSIDDFGTGYSSLAHLQTLPVQEVKIDRSFVTELTEVPADEAITSSVIDLGRRLGLTVVAEGIERPETWRRLAELGCDKGQGFLMAAPAPVDEIDFAPYCAT